MHCSYLAFSRKAFLLSSLDHSWWVKYQPTCCFQRRSRVIFSPLDLGEWLTKRKSARHYAWLRQFLYTDFQFSSGKCWLGIFNDAVGSHICQVFNFLQSVIDWQEDRIGIQIIICIDSRLHGNDIWIDLFPLDLELSGGRRWG